MNHHWYLDRTESEADLGLAHIKEDGAVIIWDINYRKAKLVVERHEDCINTLESDIKTLMP